MRFLFLSVYIIVAQAGFTSMRRCLPPIWQDEPYANVSVDLAICESYTCSNYN